MGKRAYTDYLIRQGLLRAAAQSAPPVMPADIAQGHNLQNVGWTNPAAVAATYAPPAAPPPPSGEGDPMYSGPSGSAMYGDTGMTVDQVRALSAIQSATPNSYDVGTQWRLANDPELVKQAQPGTGVTAGDVANFAGNVITGIPGGIGSLTGAAQDPVGTGKAVAETVGQPLMDIYSIPIDKRKEYTGDVIYQAANGQYDPVKDGQVTGDFLATIVGMDPKTLGLPVGQFNPNQIVSDPAKAAEVKQIYETAEANGQDGGRAVWEWYIGQFGILQRGLTDTLGDPMNLTMIGNIAGDALLGTRLAGEGGNISKAIKAAGYALKAPDVVGNLPFEGPAAIFRTGAKWSGRAGAIDRATEYAVEHTPLRSSAGQIAKDETTDLLRRAETGADIIENYGPNGSVVGPAPLEDTGAVVPSTSSVAPAGDPMYTPPTTSPGVGPVPINEAAGTIPAATTDDIIARVNALRAGESVPGPGAIPLETTGAVTPPISAAPAPEQAVPVQTFPDGSPRPYSGMSDDELQTTYRGTRDFYNQTDSAVASDAASKQLRDMQAEIDYRKSLAPAPEQVVVEPPKVDPPKIERRELPSIATEREPIQGKDRGWSTRVDTANPKTQKDLVARDYPEQWAAIADRSNPTYGQWLDTQFEPTAKLLDKQALVDGVSIGQRSGVPGADSIPGNNKSLLEVLKRENFIRMKAALREQGVDTSGMKYITERRLTEAVPDPALVEAGQAGNLAGTYKIARAPGEMSTKEYWVGRYLDTTDPAEVAAIEYNMVLGPRGKGGESTMKNLNGYLKYEMPDPIDPPTSQYLRDKAAYERYEILKKARALNHATEDEIDELFGITKAERVVNPADTELLPTSDNLQARQSNWTDDALIAVTELPSAQHAEIFSRIGPWWNDAYERGVENATPRTKVLADLELGAKLRQEAQAVGANLPPTTLRYDTSTTDGLIKGAVLDPDDMKSIQLIDQLEAQGMVRKTAPTADPALEPELFAEQNQAWETYQKIQSVRAQVQAEPGAIVQPLPEPVSGPVRDTPRVFGSDEPTPLHLSKKDLNRKSAELQSNWENDPTWGSKTGGDGIIAAAYADGRLTEQEVRDLRAAITITENGKTRTTTVMDLLVEQMLEEANKTVADAKRAVGDIIRKSTSANAPKGKMRQIGKTYDAITGLYREMYMYNPTTAVRGGLTDGLSNSIIATLEGHRKVGLDAINPITNLAMFRHNLTGADVVSPVAKIVDKWGVKAGPNVYQVVGREVGEATEKLAWEELYGIGKVIEKSHVMDAGRAFRQANDKVVRGSLWADEFGRELKRVLNGTDENVLTGSTYRESFYQKVVGVMGGGPEADAAVAELKRLADSGEGFLPSDVKRITGSNKLMHEWRETVSGVAKAADKEVDRVFFSYRQTNLDSKVRRVFMFHYWMTRALIQHTRLALSNPMLLYREVRLWQALDREAHRQGLDGPMAPLQMYFEFMKGDGGMYGISNPIAMLTPYSMFSDVFSQTYGDETTFDKWLRRSGGFVLPQIQAAATVFGLSNRYPDFLGTSTLRSTVRAVLDWDRNNGYDIFNLGPGITGDPLQHWMNKVIETANKIVDGIPGVEINDAIPPNLNKPKQDVAANLIIENAEADYGVPFKDMTDQQKQEVTDAIWAVRYGKTDNDRANEALAQMSSANLKAAVINTVAPGGMRARSEYQTDAKRAVGSYYDMKDKQVDAVPTAEQANALDSQAAISQGSPEASSLDMQNDQLDFHKPVPPPLAPGASQAEVKAYRDVLEYNAKIDREETVYNGWNTIAFGQLDPGSVQVIGGKEYYGWQVNSMTGDNRRKLADAWVLDNGAAGDLKSYRARRDAVLAANPELAGYKDWQKQAREYNGGEVWTPNPVTRVMEFQGGGMRDYRQYLERVSPQFAQQIDRERKQLEAQGVTGDELERRLDFWANSTEGYNAYRGVKDKINDPPVQDTYDPGKALPPAGPGAATEATGSTGGGTGSSGSKAPKPEGYAGYTGKWDADNNRPMYQTDLINDLNAYEQELTAFEAEYGPIENLSYSMNQNPQAWAKILPKPPENLDSYLAWSRKQQANGADGSIEAYIKMRDAEYAADHNSDESGDGEIDTTPAQSFTPAWQAAP